MSEVGVDTQTEQCGSRYTSEASALIQIAMLYSAVPRALEDFGRPASKEANNGRELEQGHRSDPSRSEGPVLPHLARFQRGSGVRGMCSAGCRVV